MQAVRKIYHLEPLDVIKKTNDCITYDDKIFIVLKYMETSDELVFVAMKLCVNLGPSVEHKKP